MVRRLALTWAMAASATPISVYALGLGDIELHSALNQPLNAEVSLLSVRPGELDGLTVSLGTNESFEKAGLDRPFFLTKLRFDVSRKPNGDPYISVTSTLPVREPFLDFLVSVNWRNGRLLREYTVLLDPPALMGGEPTPVEAPKTTVAPAAGAKAPSAGPATQAAASGPSPDTYGPVGPTDTLWSIAKAMRPEGASMEQTMLALVRANPAAFTAGNVNGLKRGFILRVPDRAEIIGVDAVEATREVRSQNTAWRDQVQEPAPREVPPRETAVAPGAESQSRLELMAPPPEEAKTEAAAEGPGPAGGQLGTSTDAALAREALESERMEKEELRSRVATLEEQAAAMQRLLTLKDEQLASLQQTLTELQKEEVAPAEAPAAVSEPLETVAEAPVAEAEPKEAPAVEAEAGAETVTEAAPEAEQEPMGVPTQPMPEGEMVANPYVQQDVKPTGEPEEAAAPAAPKPAVPAPAAQPPQPSAGGGFLGELMNQPAYLGGIGAGLLLIVLLAMRALQKRRSTAADQSESILAEPEAAAVSEAPPKETAVRAQESSLLSDFVVSDMGAIQTEVGEVDPLAEADVFLAYKRYQQAEELIQEAIDNEPERSDLKVKLLEVYHASGDKDAFIEQAQALHDLLADTGGPQWEKAVVMGRDIAPEHPLFAEGEAGAISPEAELIEEPVSEELESRGEEGPATPTFEEELDFELGTAEETEEEEGKKDDYTLEWEPGLYKTAEADQEETLAAGESEEEEMPFDFDLEGLSEAGPDAGLGSLSEPEAVPSLAEQAESVEGLDLDLSSLDLGAEEGFGATGEALEEMPVEPLEEEGEEDILLAEGDEVATKLDLAGAYIQMGDPEGARGLLDEVLEEGNEAQKQEAKELLQQIS